MKQNSHSQTNRFPTTPWPITTTNRIDPKSGFTLAKKAITDISFGCLKQYLPSWVEGQRWLAAESEFIEEQSLNHAHRF